MKFNERQLEAINHNEHPALVVASAGSGKCITGDSLVYTNFGLFRIEDIPKYFNVTEKDEACLGVIGFDKDTKEIKDTNTSHFYNMGESKTITITTAHNFSIQGTFEHPIVVKTINNTIMFKKLSDIDKTDKVVISLNNSLYGNVQDNFVLNNAYKIGCAISNKTEDNSNLLHDLSEEDGRFSSLLENKIPQSIMSGTPEVIQLFLKGVFSTSVIDINTNSIKVFLPNEYYSTNKENAKIIQLMLLTFGILSNFNEKFNTLSVESEYVEDLVWLLGLNNDSNMMRVKSIQMLLDKCSGVSNTENFYYDDIVDIKINDEELTTVYDFTVPYEHSFIANGIINHNTTLLLERIRRLVEENNVRQEDILTISFTKASADELKRKLCKLGLNDVCVGTFHSICKKALEGVGYQLSSFVDIYKLKKYMIKSTGEHDLNLDEVLSWISYQKSYGISYDDIKFAEKNSMYTENQLREFYRIYETFKKNTKSYDFDDWLILTHELYKKGGFGIPKWKYIIVDEAQDNNIIQNRLVEQWCSTDNIMLVGDHKQSIYSFRGAVPEHFMNFYKEFDNCKVISLNVNYRSNKEIVEKSNEFIKKYYGTYEKHEDSTSFIGEGGHIENRVYMDKQDEAEDIVNMIKRYHEDLGIPYAEMSVIYRNHSNADLIENKLKELNIPYRIFSNGSWLDKFEIKGLLMLLRLINDSTDDEAFEYIYKSFRCYPIKFLKGSYFEDISTIAAENNLSLFEAFMEFENRALNKYAKKNISYFVNAINRFKIQVEKKLPVDKLLNNIITFFRINEVIENKYPVDNWQEHFDSINNLKTIGKNKFLDMFLKYINNIPSKKEDVNGVTLQTIHHSKGLEYDVTFLVGLENKKFPSDKATIEEESRLFYVGITRAKSTLVISSINDSRFMDDYFEEE